MHMICNKDFVDNLSRVITTNCGHTFHMEPCFKNHMYANLKYPECPICKSYLLDTSNTEIKANLSNPTIYENNTDQTNSSNFIEIKDINI